MTYRDSAYFTFDGEYSGDYFLMNVIVEQSGLIEEDVYINRSIVEERIKGRVNPYFFGFEYEPKELKVQLAFKQAFTDNQIQNISRWLFKDYYKPLIFDNRPDRIYYALLVDEQRIVHDGLKNGYLELNFRCSSPYAYSPSYMSGIIDCTDNTEDGLEHEFLNLGDISCKPRIKITKEGDGSISIVNTSNGGQELIIDNLFDEETIIIDCELNSIESDIPFQTRYQDHNKVFLSMIKGTNYIKVFGSCLIQYQYEFQYY